jgi:hypothetical protein
LASRFSIFGDEEMKYYPLYIVLFIISVSGCSDMFVAPGERDDPVTVFDVLWKDFNDYYPFFDIKDVDWDDVYTVYRERIAETADAAEIFLIYEEMLSRLEDGHVNLHTPYGVTQYTGWYDRYPRNFALSIVTGRYLDGGGAVTGNGNIVYGWIGPVGYVHIGTFAEEDGWHRSIDAVLDELAGAPALIVDVRSNGGGSSNNALFIARRFADRERLYTYTQYRDGPAHGDFTPVRGRTVKPGGAQQFLKPVALLTNRRTFSAAEDFSLAMRELPHVVHVGDTTGGGFGNPIFRELPNGWTYRLPVWRQLTSDKENLEGIGIGPNVHITMTGNMNLFGRDTIIENAIEIVLSRND